MSNEGNPINVSALVALGPERLATLLAEVAMTNSCVRRRLQFELSAQRGENMSAAIHQWISELGEQTSLLDAEQVGELPSSEVGVPVFDRQALHSRELSHIVRNEHQLACARLSCDQHIIRANRHTGGGQLRADFAGVLCILGVELNHLKLQRFNAREVSGGALTFVGAVKQLMGDDRR